LPGGGGTTAEKVADFLEGKSLNIVKVDGRTFSGSKQGEVA